MPTTYQETARLQGARRVALRAIYERKMHDRNLMHALDALASVAEVANLHNQPVSSVVREELARVARKEGLLEVVAVARGGTTQEVVDGIWDVAEVVLGRRRQEYWDRRRAESGTEEGGEGEPRPARAPLAPGSVAGEEEDEVP